jgi:hypothetical protein
MKPLWKVCVALCVSCLMPLATRAQGASVWNDWKEDVRATRWETAATVGGLAVQGYSSWDWGSSSRFRSSSEGWFGPETASGGVDKLGHAMASYAMSNLLAEQLIRQGRSPERAALSAVLTTQAIMLYVEVFDGFAKPHGFSREDLVMNMLGSGLSYARTVHPSVRDLVDLRLELKPAENQGFRPLSISGHKYLLAFKLAGVSGLNSTPLRYLELQAGYYARGFLKSERDAGFEPTRRVFWGVGLNLGELLFGHKTSAGASGTPAGRLFFEHIQLPSTATRSERAL